MVKLWAAGSAMVNGNELAGATHDLASVADVVPREWPSPAYPLPGRGTRSVKACGAAGDGTTDDTAAIQRAIDECREVFFPAGTYLVSDTLRLRPDSRLFGEMWSIIKLRGDAAGYQDTASRKALIDVPADPAATVTLCHLFFQIQTPGGIWMDWRAGEKSMLIDTLCIPTSTAQELLWRISGNGGGFFENSWNPGVGLRRTGDLVHRAEVDVRRAAGALHARGGDPARVREPGDPRIPVRGQLGAVRADGELPERQHLPGYRGALVGRAGTAVRRGGRAGSGAAQLGDLQQPECHHGAAGRLASGAFASRVAGDRGADGLDQTMRCLGATR